jgi:hypothetical protein
LNPGMVRNSVQARGEYSPQPQQVALTGSEGAGILAKAGKGGLPPLKAFEDARDAATDRRRMGTSDRDAMVNFDRLLSSCCRLVAVAPSLLCFFRSFLERRTDYFCR